MFTSQVKKLSSRYFFNVFHWNCGRGDSSNFLTVDLACALMGSISLTLDLKSKIAKTP